MQYIPEQHTGKKFVIFSMYEFSVIERLSDTIF